jgi:hypothetical protein
MMPISHSASLIPALRNKKTGGVSPRPAAVDHVHSALGIQQVLFSLTNADMNVITDQVFTKAWDFDNYIITDIVCNDASVSLTAADGGIYQAAAKAGNALVAAAQVYTALDTVSTKGLSLTLTAFAKAILTATPILSLTGAQGGAATADFYIIGIPLTE